MKSTVLVVLAALTLAQGVLAQGANATRTLIVNNGTGSGDYAVGTMVTVGANPPSEAHQFAGWTGDTAILSNPFLATTSATIPSIEVSITATYKAVNAELATVAVASVGAGDQIRFYPRLFHTARMVGGVFEGTNGDPVNGPYETIYTISSSPPLAWNEVSADLKDYRYLRYRGPDDSYGNVAEIEFYRDGVKLTGTGFGTPGSWNNEGSTFDKALDGNTNTFFDSQINTWSLRRALIPAGRPRPTRSGSIQGCFTQLAWSEGFLKAPMEIQSTDHTRQSTPS